MPMGNFTKKRERNFTDSEQTKPSNIHNTDGYLTANLSQRGFPDTQRLKVRLDALAPLPGFFGAVFNAQPGRSNVHARGGLICPITLPVESAHALRWVSIVVSNCSPTTVRFPTLVLRMTLHLNKT